MVPQSWRCSPVSKHVNCREAGFECDFEAESEDDDELVRTVQEHAKKVHHIDLSKDDVMGLAVSV
jgi:predicted small metal-binding protein